MPVKAMPVPVFVNLMATLGTTAPELAVKRVVLLVLKSPRFLYRELEGNDPHDVASRLAFELWDSVPDGPLLEAAAAGRLATREQVVEQAKRMADDPRTRAKLRGFLLQWLKVEPAPEVAKDQALQEIWNQAANLATITSAQAIRRSLSPDDHRRLVDEALHEVEEMTAKSQGRAGEIGLEWVRQAGGKI